MANMDYRSPRYTSPLTSLSPASRGAKRTRSRTFSASHDDSDLLSLRTRGLSPGSVHFPTPPLSASSSCSSNSSFTSSHFPAAFSAFPWRPESAGPPMARDSVTIHESPDNYAATPAPDLDLELKHRLHRHVSTEPPSRLSMHAPLAVDAAHFLAVRALDPAVQAPKAPGWETEGVPTDGQKPWLQQEYVEGLIGVSMLAIDSIWPSSKGKDSPDSSANGGEVLPLKFFILETLRRSRSNAVVLQVALYYLHKVRSRIRDRVAKAEMAKDRFTHLARVRQQQQHSPPTGYPTPPSSPTMDEFTEAAAEVLATSKDPVICGRRMFLASLICASKFLLDRTYSNRAWSRLSGLPVSEINANERAFLGLLDYRLYVGGELMGNWMARLKKLQEAQGILPPSPVSPRNRLERTQSDVFTAGSLPMHELHASPSGDSIPRPFLPSSVQRSHSTASLPSHFLPDIALNPRIGEHAPKPALQRTATFGLSRSVSGSRPHQSEHLPSPLRRPCLPTRESRSCSVSSSLGTPDRLAHLQVAY